MMKKKPVEETGKQSNNWKENWESCMLEAEGNVINYQCQKVANLVGLKRS